MVVISELWMKHWREILFTNIYVTRMNKTAVKWIGMGLENLVNKEILTECEKALRLKATYTIKPIFKKFLSIKRRL